MRSEQFGSWNRSYKVSKNYEFYADFKNPNLPEWRKHPEKLYKKWDLANFGL